MEKMRFPRRTRVYLPLIVLFLLLVFLMPKAPKFSYDYQKGSPWMYETLTAQFDFPILKTEAQLQEEVEKAWQSVIPYYRQQKSVSAQVERSLRAVDFGKYSSAKAELGAVLKSIYDKGVISQRSTSDVRTFNSDLVYVQKDKRAQKVPLTEVFTVETASDFFRDAVAQSCPGADVDSLYSAVGLASLIQPDLMFKSLWVYQILKSRNASFCSFLLSTRCGTLYFERLLKICKTAAPFCKPSGVALRFSASPAMLTHITSCCQVPGCTKY